MKPLAIDLFCGLGGWTEGLLAEGYNVVGFDIERHAYGDHAYPAQLVIQDVLTLHGSQFREAALIVASPPCQAYSYMAMPWSKAKQIAKEYEDGTRDVKHLTALFDACFRIQREACEAAGRHIPLVVENVRGAQRWVGRSRWNFGSFHLWGDVPALMPIAASRKNTGGSWFLDGSSAIQRNDPRDGVNGHAQRAIKNNGGSWFNVAHNTTSGRGKNPVHRFQSRDASGVKQHGSGRDWFAGNGSIGKSTSSKSSARKAASALIAKIPLTLSRHIARTWAPSAPPAGEGDPT